MENIHEVIKELEKDLINPELIQDNKLHFFYNDETYRVQMPTQRDISEANNFKNKKYIELIQQENSVTEKELRKILKEKQNIDVDKIDEEIERTKNELINSYLSLAKKKDNEKKAIEKLTKEIEEIKNKRLELVLEKASLISPAIEIQVQDEYYKFLTPKCTFKHTPIEEDENKFVKVWSNHKSFEDDNSTLPYIALGRLTDLMMNIQ